MKIEQTPKQRITERARAIAIEREGKQDHEKVDILMNDVTDAMFEYFEQLEGMLKVYDEALKVLAKKKESKIYVP